MIDPITVLTTIAGIVNIISQVSHFVGDLNNASTEFKTLARHVKGFTLVLEGVRADLANNTRNIGSKSDGRKELARLLNNCEGTLKRAQRLYNEYKSVMDLRHQLRWRSKGKPEANSITADLVVQVMLVNLFLQNKSSESMWKLELAVEEIKATLRQMAQGQIPKTSHSRTANKSARQESKSLAQQKNSNIAQVLSPILYINRWVARLHAIRAAKQNILVKKGPKPTLKRPKRTTSLLADYAGKMARQQPDSRKRLECWLVTEGRYAFGGSAIHAGRPDQLKRGQIQLAEMANLFQAAGAARSSRAVDAKHPAVKWIVSQRSKNRYGYKWSFAAARIGSRDAFENGMVRFEKVVVILKRSVEG